MKLVGLMLARNEDWVIGLTARAALMWCDALVVSDHWSEDRTSEIYMQVFREFPDRVQPIEWREHEWTEMAQRQDALEMARKMGATHLALIDADEILTGNLLPTIRKQIERVSHGSILQLPWLQLRGDGVMVSGMWGCQNASVAFADHPLWHWAARDGYEHHQRNPMGMPFQPEVSGAALAWDGGLMHLQFLSRRRLIAKQFWYQLQERLRWPARSVDQIRNTYAPTVHQADSAKVAMPPDEWTAPYRHLLSYLDIDKEPWQEAEAKRLVEENPLIERGLDDFGLLRSWWPDGIIDRRAAV